MHVRDVANGVPTWVFALLVALIVLGVRRLRTREMPSTVALIPPAAFLTWSLIGAGAFASHAGLMPAAAAWLVGAALGAASGVALPEPRGERLPAGRVRQPGSWVPLILYLGVFALRSACGAWAAIVPAQANAAGAAGIAIGAAMTARLLVGIARWRAAPITAAT